MSSTYVPFLRGILERRSGLDLGRGGMEANLATFVHQRLTTTGLSFEQYLAQLEIPGSEELRLLIETMTVVYTWFFRDPGQFLVIEQLIQDFGSDRSMSIWVAGCATGEEAYSVALVAAALGKRVNILGTDVNSVALDHARAGRYSVASLNATDVRMRDRYLGTGPGDFVVPDSIKQSVRFQVSNLVDAAPRAPTAEGWDLIICRNVLIYFTPEQARRTLDMFAGGLSPAGYLVLGASEAILDRPTMLNVVGVAGRAVLQRSSPGRARIETPTSDFMVPLVSMTAITAADARPPIVPPPVYLGRNARSAERNGGVIRTESPGAHESTTRSVESALRAGRTALDAGDIVNAKRHYTMALQLEPTCAEAAMFAGIAHYLDGDFDEALRLLRGALCLDWTLWAACFYQALCYENIGYAEEAARSYAQVLRIVDQQGSAMDTHPFLHNWRNDLLAVAKQRAHQLTHSRHHSSQKMRMQAR